MLILQLTGLSGAGKTTLATNLQKHLRAKGMAAEVIDADHYRKTVSRDLGFTAADRKENIRRLLALACTFRQQGIIAILAAINPFEESRREASNRYGAKTVWVYCDLDILVQRDTKGLYHKALLPDGHPEKIYNLSGINDLYEAPGKPDLLIDTGKTDEARAGTELLQFVLSLLPVTLP